MNSKRVVVTGIGVVSPNGIGIHSFYTSLKAGTSGIRHIPELAHLNFGCQIGGVPIIENAEDLNLLNKYGLDSAGLNLQYSVLAGIEAWKNAELEIPDFNTTIVDYDTGVIIGTGIGAIDIMGKTLIPNVSAGNHKKLRSNTIEQMMISGPGAQLAGILSLGNIITSNSNACTTGTEAVIMGYERIKNGQAKRMIVGATDGYSPYYWALFDVMRITCREYNNNPEKGSRPMSASALGFVPGAGSGILILEDFESAKSRNAPIIAEIIGGFVNCGGQKNGGSMTAPNSFGVKKCIQGALDSSNIDPSEIDLISGHLTATKADVIEIGNWCDVLNRRHSAFPYINSLKSLIGHCLGASGAVELIACILQLKNNFIHQNLNCEDPHPDIIKNIDPDKIPFGAGIETDINVIMKASFGFGDVNACIVLKKAY
jgi:3-oxoacyl-[acyl-carrier-protein] synthase I